MSFRRWFTVYDFERWSFACIYSYFHQHFDSVCKRPSSASGISTDTTVRYLDPRFPYRLRNFFWRFEGDFHKFLHYVFWKSAIFLLAACLTYWFSKYITRVDPHVHNSQHVWSWYDHPLPSYCVLAANALHDLLTLTNALHDLLTLTFWPCRVVTHGGSRDQLYHQVRRSYVYAYLSYEL